MWASVTHPAPERCQQALFQPLGHGSVAGRLGQCNLYQNQGLFPQTSKMTAAGAGHAKKLGQQPVMQAASSVGEEEGYVYNDSQTASEVVPGRERHGHEDARDKSYKYS